MEYEKAVIVIALDFSKAFDSIRHSTLLDKASNLLIDDNIYNWLVRYFENHQHCTKYNNTVSSYKQINSSVIQGSSIGPTFFAIAASDLYPVYSNNYLLKYADDTYLLIPISCYIQRTDEINNIKQWANNNNLSLNENKSVEMIFSRPRTKINPPQPLPNITRVVEMKALGITLDPQLTFKNHISHIQKACWKTIYYLKALRTHGLTSDNLHIVYRALILPKITYASQAWWGYTNEQEKDRLEKFLNRAKKWGYCSELNTIADIVHKQSITLLESIKRNQQHKLRYLLPENKATKYNLQKPSYQIRTATPADYKNFIPRMILDSLN